MYRSIIKSRSWCKMTFRLWNEFWNSIFTEVFFLVHVIDLLICLYQVVIKYQKHQSMIETWSSRVLELFFFQKEIRIFEEPPGVPEMEQLYSARTWRPHHSTKHPQNKGTPSSPPPYQAQVRRMEMGMGGAVNGIINSILTNNDNLSICGLSFMVERTSQYALVLLVNHRANDRPT